VTELARTGASLNRGGSKQDVETPLALIRAVERRFGPIVCDLAATADNKKGVGDFIGPDRDSLAQPWADLYWSGTLWLNPEFGDVAPWAEKCAFESRLRSGVIAMLVPASVGSNWWADHVHQKAMVLALTPRVKFVGHSAAFPRDLALCVYGNESTGFDVWDWGLHDRFFTSFDRVDGCWVWNRGRFSNGYGAISVRNKTVRAHRHSYELFKGPIPEGMLVTHSCDNPPCVNPRHLSIGTPQSNMNEKVARGREAHVRGNHKLEPDQVIEIRDRLSKGETQAQIATAFGISPSSVSHIKSGSTWATERQGTDTEVK
jgi:phage N-6-adenine-methyltransferase